MENGGERVSMIVVLQGAVITLFEGFLVVDCVSGAHPRVCYGCLFFMHASTDDESKHPEPTISTFLPITIRTARTQHSKHFRCTGHRIGETSQNKTT